MFGCRNGPSEETRGLLFIENRFMGNLLVKFQRNPGNAGAWFPPCGFPNRSLTGAVFFGYARSLRVR